MAEQSLEQNFLIDSISGGRFYADIVTKDGESYVYVPQEFVYKGLRQGDTQYFNQSFLNKEYLDKTKPIVLSDDTLPDRLKNAGYEKPGLGVLISRDDFNKYSGDGNVTYYTATGQFSGPVQGIGEKDGNLVYSVAGAEGSTYGVIGPDGVPYQTTVTITQPKKRGGVLGSIARSVTNAIAGVPLLPEIVGVATGNPYLYASLKSAQTAGSGGNLEDVLKSGAKAYATYAISQEILGPTDVSAGESVGGTPGVSEVYPVDMGYTAPGTPIAPISIAEGIAASQLAYPSVPVEPTFTPAPGSLQEALPEFGVQTQASTPPYTAAPGSFQAAIGGGLLTSAAPSISLTDAFRTARTASSLLGGGEQQQQQYPTQQLPGMQATGVDILQLPQLTAAVPNIAGLLSTRQYRGPVFDLYTGLPSLLG